MGEVELRRNGYFPEFGSEEDGRVAEEKVGVFCRGVVNV